MASSSHMVSQPFAVRREFARADFQRVAAAPPPEGKQCVRCPSHTGRKASMMITARQTQALRAGTPHPARRSRSWRDHATGPFVGGQLREFSRHRALKEAVYCRLNFKNTWQPVSCEMVRDSTCGKPAPARRVGSGGFDVLEFQHAIRPGVPNSENSKSRISPH
jgi:hypothetical protein